MHVTARVPAASAVVRERAGTGALTRDAVVVGALVLFTLVVAAFTWGRWGDLSMDTGYDLLASARTAHGELPYADYVYYYGPLAPLLLGGIYALTGAALWPAIALGFVLAALAIGLTYRLARLFCGPVPSGVAAALVASAAVSSANNSYVLPHSTSAPLALVLALGALLALARWAQGSSEHPVRTLVTAGVMCGLVALTRPELAASLGAGVTVWLLVRVWLARGDRRQAWRDAALVLGPALLVTLAVYGAFLTAVSPRELVLDNLYPVDYLDAAGNVVLKLHAPWTPASFVVLAGRLVLYAAGVAVLWGAARLIAAGGRARALALVALGVGLLGFLAVLAGRPDTVRYYLRYAYEWIPAGVWLAVLALVWHARRGGAADGRRQTGLLIALVLAVAATTTYAHFTPFPNALHPDASAYLMPLAALFLVWLHAVVLPRGHATAAWLGTALIAVLAVANAGLVVADARTETVTVRGPHGSLGARPADGPALQRALDLIARESRPGEPILLAPQMTSLYVMADRRDPLPQLSLLPGALSTAAAQDRAIAGMRGVRIAVIDRTPQITYEHGAFGTTFNQRLAAWLRRDFRRAATVRGAGSQPRTLDVWIRRSS